MTTIIALIRGINVGGKHKVPMAELRTLCADEGLGEARTYIQSGNVLLEGKGTAAIETKLEKLIAAHFGHKVPVVARTAAEWKKLIEACPFAKEAADDPKRTVLLVSKKPPAKDAVEKLAERAQHDERIAWCVDGILIHHPHGQADTKLMPALIDRLVGSPATGRNWSTVLTLAGMAAE